MSADVSDLSLVRRVQRGDKGAFDALVLKYQHKVVKLVMRYVRNPAEAEDIAQEACIRLGRSIRSFKGQSAFRTWLYALTLNVVRDHQRQSLRRRRDEGRLANDPVFRAELEPGNDQRGDWLWAAVRLLPEKQRDAVLLVHSEGLSHAAAAEVLDCSENTVSWHLHEARKRLKDLLKKEAV